MASQGKVCPLGLTFVDLEHIKERQVSVASVWSQWKGALMEEKLQLSIHLILELTQSRMKRRSIKCNMGKKKGEANKIGRLRESKLSNVAGRVINYGSEGLPTPVTEGRSFRACDLV